jgi:hypothetical protein
MFISTKKEFVGQPLHTVAAILLVSKWGGEDIDLDMQQKTVPQEQVVCLYHATIPAGCQSGLCSMT